MEPTGINKFINFYCEKNLASFQNINPEGGSRLQYKEDKGKLKIRNVEGDRSSYYGIYSEWAYKGSYKGKKGYEYDVDKTLAKVVQFFCDLSTALQEVEPYLNALEHKGKLSEEECQELERVQKKLFYLHNVLKIASKGLSGLFKTALHGTNTQNQEQVSNSNYFVGLWTTYVKGEPFKTKENQALNYVHLSLENTQQKIQVLELLNRASKLLGQPMVEHVNEEIEMKSESWSLMNAAINLMCDIGNYLLEDGQHLSKQHKWQLFMQLTASNLEIEMNEKIDKMIETLRNCNVNIDLRLIEFTKLTREVLSKLKEGVQETEIGSNKRSPYRELVEAFRKATECDGCKLILSGYESKNLEAPKKALEVLKNFNFVRFVKNNTNAFSEYMLCRLGVEKYCDDDLKICDQIKKGFDKFEELRANRPAKNKEKSNTLTGYFDLYSKSNSPHVLGTFDIICKGGIKKIPFIRMGCPIIDAKASINSEFRFLLESLKDQGKKILYISAQSKDKKEGEGFLEQIKGRIKNLEGESDRSGYLIETVKSYPDNLAVVILDNDDDWLLGNESRPLGAILDNDDEWHLGIDSKALEDFLDNDDVWLLLHDSKPSSDFRRELFQRMMAGKGYYFPEEWKKEENFEGLIKKTINSTALIMFGENPPYELTEKQRLDFREINNALLSLILPSYADADFMNITCKDGKDRAMKMFSLLAEIYAIAQGRHDDKEVRWMIRCMAHAPAVLITAEPMNDHKKKLASARQYLQNEETKAIIQDPQILALPISYNGEFDFHKLENQRPSEVALKKFSQILKDADKGSDNILHNFFHSEYLDQIIDEYIASDYFISPSDCNSLQEELNSDLLPMLVQIAIHKFADLEKLELPVADLQKFSGLVAEMLYFAFLHPAMLTQIKTKQFSPEMLKKQLTAIIENPIKFMSKIDLFDGYYQEKRTIPQKMFRHCLLNIDNDELGKKIATDELFNTIEKSSNLLHFMDIDVQLPKNMALQPLFGEIACINHFLDLVIMGESAVQLMMGPKYSQMSYEEALKSFQGDRAYFDKQKLHESHVLQTASFLKVMRESIKTAAEAKTPKDKDLLKKFIPIWNHAMESLKPMR